MRHVENFLDIFTAYQNVHSYIQVFQKLFLNLTSVCLCNRVYHSYFIQFLRKIGQTLELMNFFCKSPIQITDKGISHLTYIRYQFASFTFL